MQQVRSRLRRRSARHGGEQRLTAQHCPHLQKTSTRTWSAFEAGAHYQGAHVTYLGPEASQLGTRSR